MTEENQTFNTAVFRAMTGHTIRLWRMLWRERKGALAAFGSLVLTESALPFAQAGVRGLLINALVAAAAARVLTGDVLFLLAATIGIGFAPSIVASLREFLGWMLWFFLGEFFQLLITRRRAELDVAAHEDPKQNDLLNRIAENGVWRAQNFVDRQFFLFQNILQVAIAAGVILFFRWWIFLLILACTLPELVIEARYGRNVWGIHSARAELRRRFYDLEHHFRWLPGVIELKLFQNERHFLAKMRSLLARFRREQEGALKKKLGNDLWSVVLSQAAMGFATVWFVLDVVRGNLQIGTLTFVLASVAELRTSLTSLFGNLGRQFQDGLFIGDVFCLLDATPVIAPPARGVRLADDATPEIRFEHVSFSYPGARRRALCDVSFRIPAGRKVAFVGQNGAGKTTLVKLLCRFYDPTSGRILVGGHDLRTLDLDRWYALLGVLFQDYDRYHFLVKDAIALGRSSRRLAMPSVRGAARASEAEHFIRAWTRRYEQMLGKHFRGGVEPSVGQWQKLALARTFYRGPRIFILDEPTSSIDAEAEAKIFAQLELLPADRTVLLISHRFSTVRQAEDIVVLEDGRVTEQGDHDTLVQRGGTYARLFRLQAKGYR